MKKVDTLVEKIEEAETIVIGGGSGMSNAAGMNFWYEASPLMLKDPDLQCFYNKYHFRGFFNGFYTQFESEEERWAFIAKSLSLVYSTPAQKPTYEYLQKITRNKNLHIITTNQDGLFKQYFPDEKISEIQGSFSYFQSSNTENDKNLYPAKPIVEYLLTKIQDHKIDQEFWPISDVDGSVLVPWVRSPEFLEDERYFREHDKFSKFIGKHRNDKIVFLELGVGRMTPMFIQEPFWEMTHYLSDAFYVNINPKDALTNSLIKDKSLLIGDDINEILKEAAERVK